MYRAYERRKVVLVIVAALGVFLAASANVLGESSLQVTVDANSVWVRSGQTPLLRYSYDDVPFKPYVKELYTPSGLNVLLDAPHDHLHHHGLMFALAVDGVDFWSETPVNGRQESNDLVTVSHIRDENAPRVILGSGLAWNKVTPTSRRTELRESRFIDVSEIDGRRATVVTWRSELLKPRPQRLATLSGAHYFGLGLRFVRSMDGGRFFNADGREGTVFRGQERLVQSDWCAYTTQVDGKDVTVAMFGHPENPRHPTTWFMMAEPFAYLSATLGLHEEPLELGAGQSLNLQYGVVLWDGAVESREIDHMYQQWLKAASKQNEENRR